jgi:hypothetical protein
VQLTAVQCKDAGGYAWVPVLDHWHHDVAGVQRPFLQVRVDTYLTPEFEKILGLCIEEIGLLMNNFDHGGVTQFKERPETQTFSDCANTGGFAWWLLEQRHASGLEPYFFRLGKNMLPPLRGFEADKGKCVEHDTGATSTYVTVFMLSPH